MTSNTNVISVDYYELIKRGISTYSVNKIYSSAIIQEYGLRFNEKTIMSEDIEFLCEYIPRLNQEIWLITKPLYYYFWSNSQSITHQYYQNDMELSLPTFYLRTPFLTEMQLQEYCDIWLTIFINKFELVYDERNKMSFFEKLRYNQRMLNSEEVRFCFEHATWKNENEKLKRILMRYNYYFYFLYQKLAKLKRRFH